MKLYDPAFERRLRRAIRPAWKVARRQRHPQERPWTKIRTVPRILAVLFLALPLIGAFRGLTAKWPLGTSAALLGVLLTLVPVALGSAARHLVAAPHLLPTLLWLPLRHDEIARFTWQRWWRIRAWVLLAFSELLILYALSIHGFLPWGRWPGLLLLAALSTEASVGLMAIPLVRKASYAAWLALLLLFLATLARNTPLDPHLPDWFEAHGRSLNWLHPGGWIMALWLPLTGAIPWSGDALLVLPLLALAESTHFWYRRYADDWRSAEKLVGLEATSSLPRTAAVPPKSLPAAPETIRAELRHLASPRLRGPLSRWVYQRLTAREQMLFETIGTGMRPIERRWLRLWAAALLTVPAAWLFQQLWGNEASIWPFLAFVPFGLFQQPLLGHFRPTSLLAAMLPVSYAEIARLEWKLAWPILALTSLPAAFCGAASAWFFGLPPLLGALAGGKSILAVAGLFLFLLVTRFSNGSGDVHGWHWRRLVIMSFAILGLLSQVCGVIAILVPGWMGLILLAVPAVFSGLLFLIHLHQWNHRRFDAHQLGR